MRHRILADYQIYQFENFKSSENTIWKIKRNPPFDENVEANGNMKIFHFQMKKNLAIQSPKAMNFNELRVPNKAGLSNGNLVEIGHNDILVFVENTGCV